MKEKYTGQYKVGDVVKHKGVNMIHECKVVDVWKVDGRNGVTLEPTGGYGFPSDVWEERV